MKVTEGAGAVAKFTVTLSNPVAGPVTVNYTTTNGTAVAGQDFTGGTSSIVIPALTTSAVISVPITDDAVPENTETFTLQVTSATAKLAAITPTLTLNNAKATVTVLNDDFPTLHVSQAATPVVLTEGGATGFVHVTLDRAAQFPVTLHATISPGGWQQDIALGSGGSDFTIPAGTTSLDVPVKALADGTTETVEWGTLSFTAQGGTNPDGSVHALSFDPGYDNVEVRVQDQLTSNEGLAALGAAITSTKELVKAWKTTVGILVQADPTNGDLVTLKKTLKVFGKGLDGADIAVTFLDGVETSVKRSDLRAQADGIYTAAEDALAATFDKFVIKEAIDKLAKAAVADVALGVGALAAVASTSAVVTTTALNAAIATEAVFGMTAALAVASVPAAVAVAAPLLVLGGATFAAKFLYEEYFKDSTDQRIRNAIEPGRSLFIDTYERVGEAVRSVNAHFTSVDPSQFGNVSHDVHSGGGAVYALYDGLLGRAPDAGGLKYWADRIDHGTSPDILGKLLLASDEGQARLGALDGAGFVQQLYRNTLHRDADQGGLDYWSGKLTLGADRADVANSFVFSSEHVANLQPALSTGVFVPDTNTANVARLYYGVLDRAPDASGLKANTHSVEIGGSLADVAQRLLASDEYRLVYTAPADNKYVTELYHDILGRNGNAAEVQAWTDAIAHGADRVSVAEAFAGSAEFQGHYAGESNSTYLKALYVHVLGRPGDADGVQGWTERLDSGGYSRADAANAFISSLEFAANHLANSDAAFVDGLYFDILNRHADPVGLGIWTNAIAHGADKASVADALVQSNEFQAQYAEQSSAAYIEAVYEHVLGRQGDAAGIQGWGDRLDNQGVSRSDAAHAFVLSLEFAANHIVGSDAAFVDGLYLHTMGRHADPVGLRSWSDALVHGTTRADTAVAIAESSEAQNFLAPQIEQGWHLA